MIVFVVKEEENMEMSLDRPIPLNQAIELLSKKNQQSRESNIPMSCHYQLIYDDNLIYESSLTFYDETFSLYRNIEQDLLDLNNGVLSKESKEFLDFLKPLFPKEITETKKSEPKQPKKEPKVKQKKNRSTKGIKVFCGIVTLVIVTAGVFFGIQKLSVGQQVTKSTYESLMQAHNYTDAAKKYPDKVNDIENTLYENAVTDKNSETLNELVTFNDTYPTDLGTFDLAILNADYQQSIDIYEANKKAFKDNNDRLTLVGYSYLKENQLEQAKEIAEQLSSVELEKKLFEYNQLSLEITDYDNQLKELEKGGSKNKEKAEEIAEKKFDAMNKRANL